MLHLYGSALSSPTNKVRYVANYLNIPFEFHSMNLASGEHRTPEFLKINPYGKIPAINDNGFCLAESNAIIRYLADKQSSSLYPQNLEERAIVDQWIDFSSQHILVNFSKIMFNTYFYKLAGKTPDERSLQEGRQFLDQYLPLVEKQLSSHPFIAGNAITLADLVLIASLDVSELSQVNLSTYPHITAWRKKLMAEAFYKNCHESYTTVFNKILSSMTKESNVS